MSRFEKTQFEQQKLYQRVIGENRNLLNDYSGLLEYIGQVVTVEALFSELTPQLLAKIYVRGTEDIPESSHLIPYWQIVKYCRIIPQIGEYFPLKAVVGVRRVFDDSYVLALRLPRD
jgi:hypothetical protein